MLTKKQKNLLLFINKKLRSSGVSPSYEEMKESLNLKSKSGIHRLISALEERGFIRRLPHKARALEVVKLPETASANDIYNSFSPSVIKGGLDETSSKDNKSEISVLGSIAAGTPIEAIQNEVTRIPIPSNIENNGEFFGELSLLDSDTRSATAIATEDSDLLAFLRPDLQSFSKRSPQTGNKILFNLAKVMAARLRKTSEQVSKNSAELV